MFLNRIPLKLRQYIEFEMKSNVPVIGTAFEDDFDDVLMVIHKLKLVEMFIFTQHKLIQMKNCLILHSNFTINFVSDLISFLIVR